MAAAAEIVVCVHVMSDDNCQHRTQHSSTIIYINKQCYGNVCTGCALPSSEFLWQSSYQTNIILTLLLLLNSFLLFGYAQRTGKHDGEIKPITFLFGHGNAQQIELFWKFSSLQRVVFLRHQFVSPSYGMQNSILRRISTSNRKKANANENSIWRKENAFVFKAYLCQFRRFITIKDEYGKFDRRWEKILYLSSLCWRYHKKGIRNGNTQENHANVQSREFPSDIELWNMIVCSMDIREKILESSNLFYFHHSHVFFQSISIKCNNNSK